MEIVRTATSPWGENILLGLAWDVLWLVAIAGALFVVIHALFARKKAVVEGAPVDPRVRASVPERVVRHGLAARISHWILAAATLALLITAFVPILGFKFPWLTIHWVSGAILIAYILFHVVDALVRGTMSSMWISFRDIREGISRTRGFFSHTDDPATRPGKWGMENKLFHHLTALAGLGVAVTGIFMTGRIETWFWGANPYFLDYSEATWGLIFALHGASAVALVGLLIAHFYFALRPDKFWITKSMFRGWITRDEYLARHNPQRWPVGKSREVSAVPPEASVMAASSSHQSADRTHP